MNNFIKPQTIDHAKKIEEIEQILLEYSGHLQEAHTMYAEIESKILLIKTTTQKEPTDLLEMKKQLAFGGFLVTCSMDLIVTSKNLLQAKQKWEEIYYVRHIYLTIYETLNAYSVHNKWINDTLKTQSPTLQDAFYRLSDSLKKFKKDFNYNTTIAAVRNQITAHLDSSFTDFFQKIDAIDIDKAKQALVEFGHILKLMKQLIRDIGLNSFQKMLKNALLNISDPKIINQIHQEFKEEINSFNYKN